MIKALLLLYRCPHCYTRCTFLWETKETANRADSNLTFIILTELLIYPCITLCWWKWELVLGIGRGHGRQANIRTKWKL